MDCPKCGDAKAGYHPQGPKESGPFGAEVRALRNHWAWESRLLLRHIPPKLRQAVWENVQLMGPWTPKPGTVEGVAEVTFTVYDRVEHALSSAGAMTLNPADFVTAEGEVDLKTLRGASPQACGIIEASDAISVWHQKILGQVQDDMAYLAANGDPLAVEVGNLGKGYMHLVPIGEGPRTGAALHPAVEEGAQAVRPGAPSAGVRGYGFSPAYTRPMDAIVAAAQLGVAPNISIDLADSLDAVVNDAANVHNLRLLMQDAVENGKESAAKDAVPAQCSPEGGPETPSTVRELHESYGFPFAAYGEFLAAERHGEADIGIDRRYANDLYKYSRGPLRVCGDLLLFAPLLATVAFVLVALWTHHALWLFALPLFLIGWFCFLSANTMAGTVVGRVFFGRVVALSVLVLAGLAAYGLDTSSWGILSVAAVLLVTPIAQRGWMWSIGRSYLNAIKRNEGLLCALWLAKGFCVRLRGGTTYWVDDTYDYYESERELRGLFAGPPARGGNVRSG